MTLGVKTSDDVSDCFGSTLLSGTFDEIDVVPFAPSEEYMYKYKYNYISISAKN